MKWSIAATKGPTYDLSVAAEEKGASVAARAFTARGDLGKAAETGRSPVTTYVEKFDKNGEHFEDDRKKQGTARAVLTRFR